MPWRGPSQPGEFPTLGYEVADWIEANCAIPDGDHQGGSFVLTDEQLRFCLWHWRLETDGTFTYRRSQLVRPQKWGKGPFSAALICAEAEGPVLFDGWDAHGEPVGRPWATPWVQVTAISVDQTDNVWRALVPMIELGDIGADIDDTGLTRINLRGGGRIEPVTSNATSRLGARITFAVMDETHSWTKQNGGQKLADTLRRNLAGMNGRSVETTNAWDPSEDSVAQRTAKAKATDIHRDMAQPRAGLHLANPSQRRRAMKDVYGDSWWVNLDRIEAEYAELAEYDPGQAQRFFCNMITSGSDAAFDPLVWKAKARETEADGLEQGPSGHWYVRSGELITVGFDGAKRQDSTALIGTHVHSGFQWVIGLWERPPDADDDWEIDDQDVDDVLAEALDEWKLWRAYCDPPYWGERVKTWQGRYGAKRVIAWDTNTKRREMAYALRSYKEAMSLTGPLSHDGDKRFADHVGNARKRPTNIKDEDGRPLWHIQKPSPSSPLKIDAAMAGCLSWEARGDCIAAGAAKKKARGRAGGLW
jgi:hypothetical protein